MVLCSAGCETPLPSMRFDDQIDLPTPRGLMADGAAADAGLPDFPDGFLLTPLSLIPVTFNRQPGIKSSFQRFKSEEARYDFFVASRDSLTPRLRTSNDFSESRRTVEGDNRTRTDIVDRNRSHTIEMAMEKRFFDTTELDLAVGYDTTEVNDDIGNVPFASATMRYPLWVSRQKLERTSDDIFRQNELNDTQLAYIEGVRSRLRRALFSFYDVVQQRTRVGYTREWYQDFVDVRKRMDSVRDRDIGSDIRRIDGEIARRAADLLTREGRLEIDVERLKDQCGIPFSATIEIVNEPFNPFEGMSHEELRVAAIRTDPEIATQQNAVRNAEVQLDLAKRGRWDLTLLLAGRSALEGRGNKDGVSDWSMSVGLDVSKVDSRVTDSLIRQADANIARFSQAIARRTRSIFVDTLEPYIRLQTVTQSRRELIASLPNFENDYNKGVEDYFAGTLNIDDLLTRRQNLFNQQSEIVRATFLLGANIAELCSATGKFFELLEEEHGTHGDASKEDAPIQP
jgi:Outer membrane efflux protein